MLAVLQFTKFTGTRVTLGASESRRCSYSIGASTGASTGVSLLNIPVILSNTPWVYPKYPNPPRTTAMIAILVLLHFLVVQQVSVAAGAAFLPFFGISFPP